MNDDERVRIEYEEAVQVVRSLTDVRFKLLAFVPTTAGAVVALVSPGSTGVELLAIGLLGLAATLGVLVYELRNAQLSRSAAARINAFQRSAFPGGPLAVPPRAVGPVALSHGLALAFVYGAALAGWAYLVAWGAFQAGGVDHARVAGLVVGGVVGLLAVRTVLGLEDGAASPAPDHAPLRGSV
jgi:hypothetical protein